MFKASCVLALFAVLASISQVEAGKGYYFVTGHMQYSLDPTETEHEGQRQSLCCSRSKSISTQLSAFHITHNFKHMENGQDCTYYGTTVKNPACNGGFQRFGDFYECYLKLGNKDYYKCNSVEAMTGTGDECAKV
ncbi:uncharacterized protein MELLADRAFT_91852 [Melampsora larici-populina 98AG31]|uniref:Secreted protein n=1 Tax=Melampsora larici-populina (strain 98AG31 / pathotype 3-4-7) TaxID=747676 RepID=F4S0L2_MELLP|nr:uncharacterized protein MELLADRAFT_91852 [Melampsora larici-populina 98AG31]EGG01847.1 hypothetical protein MELLADRAFT_91852 [Melampsora larici-populina 98AG31]